MIAWLWSPFGRALAAVGAVLGTLVAVYLKGRREGVQELEREQNEASQDRLRRAMRAADRIDAERLREPDEHQRK
jgi:hypothetical protein